MNTLGAWRLLSAVALAGLVAGCGGNSFTSQPGGSGGVAQSPMGRSHLVAPGRAGQLVAQGFHVPASHQVFPAKKKKGGCIYLSDNSTGTVSIYNSTTLAQTGSISGGGWGVGDDKANAFIGSPSGGTIAVYKQCDTSGVSVGTLTGTSGGSPYGMWTAEDGSLIAIQWPNIAIDQWGPGAGGSEPYLGSGSDSNMGEPYFVFYDALDKKSQKKGEHERIILNGWNTAFSHAQTDSCTRTLPSPTLTCSTLIANSGGFPGGVVGYHDLSAGKFKGGSVPNLIVNDQYGTLTANACDMTSNTCTATGSFNYAGAGGAALDYTAIVLGTKCKDVWGANIFFIGSALNGDAQQNTPLPVGSGMALGSATAAIAGAVPLGIAVSPPCKDT